MMSVPATTEAERYPSLDEYGMSADDWRWIAWGEERQDFINRWRALKALWLKPVVNEHRTRGRSDGVICYRDARDEEWTVGQAMLATIALIFNRQWSDNADRRHRARSGAPYIHGTNLCFWDADDNYGGYDVMVCEIYPGCRVSIFSDGECLI